MGGSSSQQRRQWQSIKTKNREPYKENTLTQLCKQSRATLPWACLSFCWSLPPHAWASQLYRQSNHRAHRGVMCARCHNWLLLLAGNWKGVQQLPKGMALLKTLLGLQGFGQKCSISSNQGEQFWKDKGHLKSSGWVSLWKKTHKF